MSHDPSSDTAERTITCPECGAEFQEAAAREQWAYCETCGEHPGVICPHCEELVDLVWYEINLERKAEGREPGGP